MSDAASGPRVIFLKLGGSLITDKDHPKTSNRAAIARALGELRKCMSRTSATFVLLRPRDRDRRAIWTKGAPLRCPHALRGAHP